MAEQKAGGWSTPYKYTGKELDTEIGLYDYGARFYDPSISLWTSVDPLTGDMPDQGAYNYTFQNPIMYNDPTGMKGEWIPEIDETSGKLSFVAESGDSYCSLVESLGGLENSKRFLGSSADKYVSSDNSVDEGTRVEASSSNVFAEGIDFYYNTYDKNEDNDSPILYQNTVCHSAALCGGRDQSLIDFDEKSTTNNLNKDARNRIVNEQYSETNSLQQNGVPGRSILTFSGHTATYLNTGSDGTDYYLSKNTVGPFSIDTRGALQQAWGKQNGSMNNRTFNLKKNYYNTKLPLNIY